MFRLVNKTTKGRERKKKLNQRPSRYIALVYSCVFSSFFRLFLFVHHETSSQLPMPLAGAVKGRSSGRGGRLSFAISLSFPCPIFLNDLWASFTERGVLSQLQRDPTFHTKKRLNIRPCRRVCVWMWVWVCMCVGVNKCECVSEYIKVRVWACVYGNSEIPYINGFLWIIITQGGKGILTDPHLNIIRICK